MSGELAYQQRKQNTVLPRALTKSTPESVSKPEPPESDHESEHHPLARKEPEKPPQEVSGSNAKKESSNQFPTSDTEAKEEPEPESEHPVEKKAEQQEKLPELLPLKLNKETVKSDHPPAKEAEGHLRSQAPPPAEENQQQKKQAAQWPPK